MNRATGEVGYPIVVRPISYSTSPGSRSMKDVYTA
jgi:formate-dependent phosphoribosylglycinamide formyltransferase (GAR transformylase)